VAAVGAVLASSVRVGLAAVALRPAGEDAAGDDAFGRGKGQIRQTRRRRQAEAHTTAGAREEAVG